MIKISLIRRIWNFILQILLLPLSVVYQGLFGYTFVVLVLSIGGAFFDSSSLMGFFVLPLTLVWDYCWGFVGIHIVQKRFARINQNYDNDVYSYQTLENVDKDIKDNSGTVVGSYTTKEQVTHYVESDEMMATRFALQIVLLYRIVSIVAAFFAIFTDKYAVSVKPLGKLKSAKAYIFFDINKFSDQSPKVADVLKEQKPKRREDNFDLTEKGIKEYKLEVELILEDFFESRFIRYARTHIENIRKMETGRFKKVDSNFFFPKVDNVPQNKSVKLQTILKRLTNKAKPDDIDYALFDELFLSKYDHSFSSEGYTFLLIKNSELTKTGKMFIERLEKEVLSKDIGLRVDVTAEQCDLEIFLKNN